MPQQYPQKKSTAFFIKIFLILFAVSSFNSSCENCDDEDYDREHEEKVAVQQHQHTDKIIVNKK